MEDGQSQYDSRNTSDIVMKTDRSMIKVIDSGDAAVQC